MTRLVRLLHEASLDAPLVALLWQTLVARALSTEFANPLQAALVPLGVWLAYAADRLVDARRIRQPRRARHRFFQAHGRRLIAIWCATAALALVLGALTLDGNRRLAALATLAVLTAYLAATQRWHILRIVVPREVAVGGLFAIGTTIFFAPFVAATDAAAWAAATLGFAALCALDCLVVSWLERVEDLRDGELSTASRGGMRARGLWVCATVLIAVAALSAIPLTNDPTTGRVIFVVALGLGFAGLLVLLEWARRRPDPAPLAPWTDFALLLPTPLLFVIA